MRLLTLFCACFLAACSPDQAAPNSGNNNSNIIRLADADARGLDPQLISDLASIRVAADQFEGLTRFDAKGDAEAGLAEGWQISSDGLVWTFQLRDALSFSDGTPITANVFQKAIARIREEKKASPHVSLFSIIKTIDAPNERDVIVHLEQPFPQLPALLAHPAMAALPFHLLDKRVKVGPVKGRWSQAGRTG